MSVFLRRVPVRGPTGVAYAITAFDWRLPQGFFEIAEFAWSVADLDPSVLIDDCNACGVIAAVFESPKPVEHQGHDFLRTDVSDYSAHNVFSCSRTKKADGKAGITSIGPAKRQISTTRHRDSFGDEQFENENSSFGNPEWLNRTPWL
jgi:hypothetical protein